MKSTIGQARIAGLAAAVPAQRQAIADSPYRNETARRKFASSTGIHERRLARPDQCTSDFAEAAAMRLLDELAWDRESVDLLVFVSQTPDYVMPATAVTLQERLGLARSCSAFDVNLGCSGYTHGLAIASSLIAAAGARKALLLVGDTSSRGARPSIESEVPPLFGDAGTATALERSDAAAPLHVEMSSDGSGAQVIMQPLGGQRHPYRKETFQYDLTEDGRVVLETGYQLEGLEVFNFSVREVPPAVRSLLDYAQVEADAVDAFVFHQANGLINEAIRKQLRLPREKVPSTLARYANTSSATIPLTLVSELRERLQREELTLLLCGFGIGLSWSTALCRTDGIVCPEVIEL